MSLNEEERQMKKHDNNSYKIEMPNGKIIKYSDIKEVKYAGN
jgi:hypothetical protein